MDIRTAAKYWKSRLENDKPIYRVRVRRLLELAGAERRGYAIVNEIRQVLDEFGLMTIPDFESVWLGSLVRIRLTSSELEPEEQSSALDQTSTDENDDTSEDIDPALSEEQLDKPADAVAEPLNAPEEVQAETGTPTSQVDTDPVVRVSSLAAAHKGVVSVSVNDPISTAITRMIFENYSQLAVMQGARDVKGMISWESIAKRSLQQPPPSTVKECMTDAVIVNANDPLFERLPLVEQHGYVLVRHQGKITGVVTATDFATELASMSQAFMRLGTIEKLIRKKLHPCLSDTDFVHLEDHSRAKQDHDFSKLTFGENVRFLERAEIWSRLNLPLDRAQFTTRLSAITEIRNDVMHFDPDPLSPTQTRNLDQMESFLRQMFG